MEAAATTADELRTAWGRRLRTLRLRNGHSQVHVAAMSELDQSAVSRAERGKAELDTYVRLSTANGTTLEALSSGALAESLDAEAEPA